MVSKVVSKYPELNVPNALHNQSTKQPKSQVHEPIGCTPKGVASLIVALGLTPSKRIVRCSWGQCYSRSDERGTSLKAKADANRQLTKRLDDQVERLW